MYTIFQKILSSSWHFSNLLLSSCNSSSYSFLSKKCICSTRHVRHTFLIFEQIHIFLSSAWTVSRSFFEQMTFEQMTFEQMTLLLSYLKKYCFFATPSQFVLFIVCNAVKSAISSSSVFLTVDVRVPLPPRQSELDCQECSRPSLRSPTMNQSWTFSFQPGQIS